jgi:hypothetical protein
MNFFSLIATAVVLLLLPRPDLVFASRQFPYVQSSLQAEVSDIIIHFNKNANLNELKFVDTNGDNVINRVERRTQVYTYLNHFAKKTQFNVENLLKKYLNHGISYESFWIYNAIHVKNITVDVLHDLIQFGKNDIERIVPASHGGLYHIKSPTQPQSKIAKAESKYEGENVQWNIKKVNADKMWEKGFNGSSVVVATLDGGVNYKHESLVNSYRGTKSDGTFDHDYNWNDWAYKNDVPFDSDGHGTNVQGIATSAFGYGVAPGSKWISGKIFNYAGYSETAWTLGGW